jgi:hypothetical protein
VNVVKPSRHAEELRLRWKDKGELVGRAGWSLTLRSGMDRRDGAPSGKGASAEETL